MTSNKTNNFTFRTNNEDNHNLQIISKYYKISRSSLIRKLLTEEALKLKLIEEKSNEA